MRKALIIPVTAAVLGLDLRQHVHAAVLAARELNDTIDLGEEGIVATQTNVLAGLEASTTLTDQDGPCGHDLAGEALHAKALRV